MFVLAVESEKGIGIYFMKACLEFLVSKPAHQHTFFFFFPPELTCWLDVEEPHFEGTLAD